MTGLSRLPDKRMIDLLGAFAVVLVVGVAASDRRKTDGQEF